MIEQPKETSGTAEQAGACPDGVPAEFTIPSISIAGAPEINWTFTGDVARAQAFGATAYAETRHDGSCDLRITDSEGDVIADIVVRKMPSDESITVSLMNVACALLWSHYRWQQGKVSKIVR